MGGNDGQDIGDGDTVSGADLGPLLHRHCDGCDNGLHTQGWNGADGWSAGIDRPQDSAPASVLTGAASIVGANVLQAVTGGIAVTDYELKAVCATSAGRILAVIAILPVR